MSSRHRREAKVSRSTAAPRYLFTAQLDGYEDSELIGDQPLWIRNVFYTGEVVALTFRVGILLSAEAPPVGFVFVLTCKILWTMVPEGYFE